MVLTQKETMLLEDLKTQEQVCIEKYDKYAREACDANLRKLLTDLGNQERAHLQTIQQMMSGTVPNMQSGQNAAPGTKTVPPAPANCTQNAFEHDKYFCQDLLGTEKHVSSVYDTSIFEFKDESARNALNHIQKEEQEHGKKLYDYMAGNGMYS